MINETRNDLVDLLLKAERAHQQAFAATEGADPALVHRGRITGYIQDPPAPQGINRGAWACHRACTANHVSEW